MTKKKGKRENVSRTTAEWISLIVSSLLVAVVVAAVIALWLDPTSKPASFRVERSAVRNETGFYYLSFKVFNDGDETGAQVTVEGKVRASGDEESASTIFDFIPAHSSVEGTLIFTGEPSAAELRVVSYQQP